MTGSRSSYLHRYILTSLGLMLVAGCGFSPTPKPTNSTSIFAPTISPVAFTDVPTILPATLISTPTKTFTQTTTATLRPPTPLPSLSPIDAQAKVLELLQTNAGCQLPCWWGITPGKSSWQTVQQFLASFANRLVMSCSKDSPNRCVYSAYFSVPEAVRSGSILAVDFVVDNGIVESIYPDTGNLERYMLPQLLDAQGQPSEVLIQTYSNTPSSELPFFLVLFYPRQGIMALYVDNAEKRGDSIHVCFNRGAALTLQSPNDNNWALKDLAPIGGDKEETDKLRPLDEVTNMTIEGFYSALKTPGTLACLETLEELWTSH